MERKPMIFLSYTREDKTEVTQLYKKLTAEGFKPWMDVKDILPGKNWDYVIKQALKEADFVLICLSKNSDERRGYIQREIKIARDNRKEKLDGDIYIIPVLLEECIIPDGLSDIQTVKLFEKNGFKKLTQAIIAGMEQLGSTSS